MNAAAKAHLAKAKEYADRGEQFYRMAAEQMRAAKDSGATMVEIGDGMERSATWCKDIMAWHETPANRGRYTGDLPFSEGKGEVAKRHAKSVLREKPEIVAELTPAEQRTVARKLDEEAAKRQKTREQSAKQKERDHLGDETVDDLELREELQSTEYLLITARGNLRGFVKHVGELGIENTPENWRQSCLDWVDDLEGHLGMAKALLAGDNIDWAAFDELLAKEAN
jgi:hypothetical protein